MIRRVFLEPTANKWESGAVFNPTAIEEDGITHLIYRAVRSPNYSSLGHAEIEDGLVCRHDKPFMAPTEEYEREGVEDPRITKINGTFYLFYTAWDGKSARIAYAAGRSIDNLKKQGIIGPNIPVARAIGLVNSERYKNEWRRQLVKFGMDSFLWDKDAVLFPEKISGKYAMLHRLEPDIQLVLFDSFEDLQNKNFWEDYLRNIGEHIFMHPQYEWESEKIGAGATPIKTNHGWLLLYHGVEGKRKHSIYSAGAALFSNDIKHGTRLKEPLFQTEYEWEKVGNVNNVVFPEGATVEGPMLNIFYGAADRVIGLAQLELKSLIKKLNL